jgi:hypothetical protein
MRRELGVAAILRQRLHEVRDQLLALLGPHVGGDQALGVPQGGQTVRHEDRVAAGGGRELVRDGEQPLDGTRQVTGV